MGPTTPRIGRTKLLLISHPRCCGTAVELYLEQCGFRVECNVFDNAYHFLEKREQPYLDSITVSSSDTYQEVISRLCRAEGPLLVRVPSYTVARHLDSDLLMPLLQSFDERLFLVRSPAYALASHRLLAAGRGDGVTREETGYTAQLRLALWLRHRNMGFRVRDAHQVLNSPAEQLGFLGIGEAGHTVEWSPGMRERWGMWPDWKDDVAKSTSLRPFVPAPDQERLGRQDPLFTECNVAFERLLEFRDVPGNLAQTGGSRT